MFCYSSLMMNITGEISALWPCTDCVPTFLNTQVTLKEVFKMCLVLCAQGSALIFVSYVWKCCEVLRILLWNNLAQKLLGSIKTGSKLTVLCRDVADALSLFTRLSWINMKYELIALPWMCIRQSHARAFKYKVSDSDFTLPFYWQKYLWSTLRGLELLPWSSVVVLTCITGQALVLCLLVLMKKWKVLLCSTFPLSHLIKFQSTDLVCCTWVDKI